MCKCVGAYVYMRVCLYMYARTYVTMYVCMYACIYVLIHTCVHACMFFACFVFKINGGGHFLCCPTHAEEWEKGNPCAHRSTTMIQVEQSNNKGLCCSVKKADA